MPERIARLERDKRGYPIPWNVLRGVDGVPIFTVNNDQRHWQAIRQELCPICGERLGRWRWWAGGPRAAFHEHGWYLDLPGHRECIRFALETCPYLAAPSYIPNRIDVPDPAKLLPQQRIMIDQSMDHNRPPLFVAVCADRAELQENGPLMLPYTRPLRPVAQYEFWLHGKQIPPHRALPILRGIFGAGWTLPATTEDSR